MTDTDSNTVAFIKRLVHIVHQKLPMEYNYTERNYQNALGYFLHKRGKVELEAEVSYTIVDGDKTVCVGVGRADIVFTKDYKGSIPHILELKVIKKHKYPLTSFCRQLKRYCHHFPGPCVGVLVIFSHYGPPRVIVP